ncbi:cobalamin B12-binding domain-containing protein [Jiella sonneratiae]|uniref:Cobalamin B12-binding domain-containing protein n=1 Tax=Jiella sonneratiae TaxID=2816856 RepID=A0ABS3J8Z1_9HYPH|nr:cobalamin B12-binding domain-containing protein [Jiella sonneratiae]MBO0905393.1 cobalamin B12-binding domain-containing protein [Jiella sonneratiae]
MAAIPYVAESYRRIIPHESKSGRLSSDIYTHHNEEWKKRLSEAIVAKVIPSLYAAHRTAEAPEEGSRAAQEVRRRAEAERFLGLVLSDGPDAQWRHLLDLRASGMDLETLLTDIMSPAVRELGAMWLDDRLSFVEVTTKSARLQHMIRSLGRVDACELSGGRASVLLAPAPGEQHTFGLFVLAELFLAAGWSVSIEANVSLHTLCQLVETRRYDAIGISVGSERFLPHVGAQVEALRHASSAHCSRIFLGGWAFTVPGQSIDDYGADLVATDGRSAVERAQTLLLGH